MNAFCRSFSIRRILCLAVACLGFWVPASGQTQSELYSSNFEPTPPESFPATYADYQILPGTISPDQQFAAIYPKRSRLYALDHYGLFLVALKPFRVMAQLPLGNSNLAENTRCDFASSWAKDSSAFVMIAGYRWGPEKVSVVALKEGKITGQMELTKEVRRIIRSDFKASRARPYNDHYEFVFTDHYSGIQVPKDEKSSGWDLDDAGHVRIECVCTTDPKGIDEKGWSVKFSGVWDIRTKCFLSKEFVRVLNKQPEP